MGVYQFYRCWVSALKHHPDRDPIWLGFVSALNAKTHGLMPWVMVYLLLGLLSQVYAPVSPNTVPELPWINQNQPSKNLIPPYGLNDLYGWSPKQTSPPAFRQPDGFRRVYKLDPNTRAQYVEILSNQTYDLDPNQVYTLSFYFRHDGNLSFNLSVYTSQGHQPRTPSIVDLGNGLYRAYTVYKVGLKDKWVRMPDLINLRGTWSYIDIGYAQIEPGPVPSAYRLGDFPLRSPLERMKLWFGNVITAFLLWLASLTLLSRLPKSAIGLAISLGLLLLLLIGLWQREYQDINRAMGLTFNPNAYGATAVMMVVLARLFIQSRLYFLVFITGALMVFLSGSQAAWIGLVGFGILQIFYHYKNRWLAVSLLVTVALALGLFSPSISENRSLKTRLQIWTVAWQAFREHPLTGIGVSMFPYYYQEHRPHPALEPNARHAHNVFLQLLAEGGILSFLAFVILWGAIALKMRSQRQAIGLMLLAIAVLLNLWDFTWFYAGIHYPLWIALASSENSEST